MGLFGGYIIVFIVAAATTAAVMPLVLAVARRRHWLAIPGERTVHTVPTPNIGGLGLLCGVAVALLAARQMDRFDRLFTGNSELIGVLLAAVIIALVGFRDDVREVSAPGRVAATILAGLVLDEAGITLNKNTVPNDPRSPFVTSGVRIGTPSVTTQGMKEPEMAVIAAFIAEALRGRQDPDTLADVRKRVSEFCAKFPAY